MRTHYRTRIEYASAVEAEAIQLLIEHGAYSEDDYEADAQVLADRRAEAMSDAPVHEWEEEGLLLAA